MFFACMLTISYACVTRIFFGVTLCREKNNSIAHASLGPYNGLAPPATLTLFTGFGYLITSFHNHQLLSADLAQCT